jgi:hypothetical protein
MFRRRPRRPREIAFSLDSFLDLVANVVGIIIRLILVAWVGARSYQAVIATPLPATRPPAPAAKETADTARRALDQNRKELQDTQDRLLAQLRQLEQVHSENEQAGKQLALLGTRQAELEKEQGALDRAATNQTRSTLAVAASLEDLRKRRERLDQDIKALEKLPSAKRVLRYRTPVSRPVHTDEYHFECRDGRVAFVDVAAFLAEIRETFRERGKELRTQWQVQAVTAPVGPFRLRYVVERERGLVDGVGSGLPNPDSNFRYTVSAWTVEPLAVQRGEAGDAAMSPSSAFRQIVDTLDPDLAVVTFWVYPDSFPLYRRLRDYLYERGIEVAGRPLPIGYSIASSRHGSVSRGQ